MEKNEKIDLKVNNIGISKFDIDFDKDDLPIQKSKRYGQDTRYRRYLANWVMFVVAIWLLATIFVIAFNHHFGFNINETVCITLLATTTVNVLGLAFIVLKGIFRHDGVIND